ncbi:MAG: protein kinase [Deltaproteobacteria bacterium]|jgi:serine/threonine protein kinase
MSADSTSEIDLFHEVLDQSPEARRHYIAIRHAGDAERIERLGRLLEAHERAEGVETAPVIDPVPERIGPYRVLEVLGEGGMGVVYAAEQTQPIRRRVAIKVIKLGMDTKEVIARFEAERQALAMLDHPGVARVFDAGSTDNGRPFFVMELVRGVPIHEYCDTHELALRDRLELFLQVCDAVHHAHQKGIIHRDIKPSNVLVAVQDSGPAPKIIDFGVMKATSARLSEHTFFTEQGQLIGTPEYMSPEQAEMSGLDVDTRTDVYSLGVMLYQIITGELPFDSNALRSGGYGEIRRIIREVDPVKPSARTSRWPRALRGDLDRVVMCAIAKDRTHRYESASAFRDDVRRYLVDEPVQAGKPGAAYRLIKFVKRKRYLSSAVALVFIAGLAGVIGLWVGLQDAREAEALAARRADNAAKASAFLQKVLFHVDPEYGGGKLSLLEVMGIASRSIEEDLGQHPEVEASVRESIGVAYRRLSRFEDAEPHLRRSLEIRRELFGDLDLQTARSFIAMADLMFEYEGRIDESLDFLDRAMRGVEARQLTNTQVEGWLLLDVGIIALAGDRLVKAKAAFTESGRLIGERRGSKHPDVSRATRGLAEVALLRGDFDEAERIAREAVALCEGEGTVYIGARAKLVLARVLMAKGELESAAKLLAASRAQFERTVDGKHIRMAELDAVASELALLQGDAEEAKRFAERCLSVRSEILHARHWERLEAEYLLQRARIALGETESADAVLRSIGEQAARDVGDDHRLRIAIARARVEGAKGDEVLVGVREARLAQLVEKRDARLRGGR